MDRKGMEVPEEGVWLKRRDTEVILVAHQIFCIVPQCTFPSEYMMEMKGAVWQFTAKMLKVINSHYQILTYNKKTHIFILKAWHF